MIGRRDLITWTAAAAALALMASPARSDESAIRVGLIGAGSGGIGLAKDTMRADRRLTLVAIADESGEAARRALNVFDHPLRKGGRHPQMEAGAAALFGADALDRLMAEARPDVLLVAVPAAQLVGHLERTLVAGIDTYIKPTTGCDGSIAVAVRGLAAHAERLGVVLGADAPWCFESLGHGSRPAGYLSTQTARAASVGDFLWRRGLRLNGSAQIEALLDSHRDRFQAA